jgi:hypothetical protein
VDLVSGPIDDARFRQTIDLDGTSVGIELKKA